MGFIQDLLLAICEPVNYFRRQAARDKKATAKQIAVAKQLIVFLALAVVVCLPGGSIISRKRFDAIQHSAEKHRQESMMEVRAVAIPRCLFFC